MELFNIHKDIKNILQTKKWFNKEFCYFDVAISSTDELIISFNINAFCISNNIQSGTLCDFIKFKKSILEILFPVIDMYKNKIDYLILKGSSTNFDVKWYYCTQTKLYKSGLTSLNDDDFITENGWGLYNIIKNKFEL